MTSTNWTPNESISEIKRLTTKGVLGFYTQIEATEIVAFARGTNQPINLFTLLVAEDHVAPVAIQRHFLNSSRIKVPGLYGWSFGILRYTLPIDQLLPAFERLVASQLWDVSGSELHQDAVAARPRQFVPPDSLKKVPWNRVLKNNFWNGSYVFEWGNIKKSQFDFLLTISHRLQVLSDAIRVYVPMHLASFSDRLGNIVLQLPVTVLMARFYEQQDGTMIVETGWHPHAQPRPLRASVELEFDNTITGYNSSQITGDKTLLPVPPGPGVHRGLIWDEANGLVLAATGSSAFIRSSIFNMHRIIPEPRVFTLQDTDSVTKKIRVQVHNTLSNVVGIPENDGNVGWTRRRMYREETSQLVHEHRFVQYRPQPGQQNVEHEKALNDICHLISRYGSEGAWLWDPYLSAIDILRTLFFSPHGWTDLRGLTAAGKNPSGLYAGISDFIQKQRDSFENAQSNFLGMRLEYRVKSGSEGWDFHDRFIIFPQKDDGALAWSLGTSINGIGKAHHILQRVDDGQQVMDAFVELWNKLEGPEHLIWKVPA